MTGGSGTELDADVRRVCDAVSTTLGPFGANKLLVAPDGTVSTTNSGYDILDQLDVADPAVTLLSQTASDVRREYGDGATSTVLLVGALLREAATLRDRGVHPTTIVNGYTAALATATDQMASLELDVDHVGLETVAKTALTGIRDPGVRDRIATRLADLVRERDAGFDLGSIRVCSRIGGTPGDTELVSGVVLDTRPAHESMPRDPDRRGVVLVSDTIDLPAADGGLTLEAGGFEERAAVADAERGRFQATLDDLVDAGVGFVATERAVNERVQALLGAHGILAVQRLDRADLDALARSTGADVLPDLDHATAETIGDADAQIIRKAGRDHTIVDAPDSGTATVFCRAPDPRSVASFESAVEAAVAALASARGSGTVVPGGGAAEMQAARSVKQAARGVDDRRQLAMTAYGDALTAIPRVLARSVDVDAATTVARLGAAHAEGRRNYGVDAWSGGLGDVLADDPVVLPAEQLRGIWQTATRVASQIVRIDDRLDATALSSGADSEAE